MQPLVLSAVKTVVPVATLQLPTEVLWPTSLVLHTGVTFGVLVHAQFPAPQVPGINPELSALIVG
jgi:hypothetical protein